MNQDCALVHEFVRVAKRFFERYPKVDHVLSVGSEGEYCVLEIPMSNEGGFDIHLDVGDREILIHCGDFHDHHELDSEIVEFVNHYFGFIYDLLSVSMRLREFCSGRRPYKWTLECLEDGHWSEESTTGMLLYNYFGRKSELIMQNKTLPAREEPILK